MKVADNPPPPDTEQYPRIEGQTVVDLILSETTDVRGIITVDPAGLFRVRTEFWDTGDWDVARAAFWNQGHIGTFTDTVDQARLLCRELMSATRTS